MISSHHQNITLGNGSPSRQGKGLLRFLITVIIVAVIGYIAWVTWSTYQRTGTVNPFAALNSDERQAAHDDARPHLNRAVELGADALEKLKSLTAETFGEGGYIDQASDWMRTTDQQTSPIREALQEEQPAASPPPSEADPRPTPPTAPAPQPTKNPETARLEQQILDAESAFQSALTHYQAANPANGGWTPERQRAVKQAHQGFSKVRDSLTSGSNGDLYNQIERYGQQPDHNPAVLRRAREMAQHNQRLLTNARRMSSAF